MQRTQIMQSVPYHFECRKVYTISNKANILSSKHNTMTYMLSSLDILVLFIFSNPVEIRITVIYISDTERCLKSTYMFTYFEWKKKLGQW